MKHGRDLIQVRFSTAGSEDEEAMWLGMWVVSNRSERPLADNREGNRCLSRQPQELSSANNLNALERGFQDSGEDAAWPKPWMQLLIPCARGQLCCPSISDL